MNVFRVKKELIFKVAKNRVGEKMERINSSKVIKAYQEDKEKTYCLLLKTFS